MQQHSTISTVSSISYNVHEVVIFSLFTCFRFGLPSRSLSIGYMAYRNRVWLLWKSEKCLSLRYMYLRGVTSRPLQINYDTNYSVLKQNHWKDKEWSYKLGSIDKLMSKMPTEIWHLSTGNTSLEIWGLLSCLVLSKLLITLIITSKWCLLTV